MNYFGEIWVEIFFVIDQCFEIKFVFYGIDSVEVEILFF